MLNFRGTMVNSGLVITVDTRFDGGRHLRIARALAGAHVWACGKPAWWKCEGSSFPALGDLKKQISLARAPIVLCDIPNFYIETWFDIRDVVSDSDANLVVMGEFKDIPEWSDVHFRTGLRVELAEEIGSINKPVGEVAEDYNVTKQQVRECRTIAR